MLAKGFAVALAVVAILWVALLVGLRIYDDRTREELSTLATRELSPGADNAEMTAFMRAYTVGYDRDAIKHQYIGLREQTKIDALLYRKVTIALSFDPDTGLYKNSSIFIHYTWL